MTIISFKGSIEKIPLTIKEIQFIVDTTQKLLGTKLPKNLPLVLNCCLVSEAKITGINTSWRHKKQSSPIIAFPDYYLKLPDEPLQEEIHLGDMIICPKVIRERTKENFPTFNYQNFRLQFIFSFIHSLVHLYGYTHENDNKANKMESMEKRVQNIVIKKLIKS
jgi:probable rRNA maturation factor